MISFVTMKDGYQTRIGERGNRISSGQTTNGLQIARVFLKKKTKKYFIRRGQRTFSILNENSQEKVQNCIIVRFDVRKFCNSGLWSHIV